MNGVAGTEELDEELLVRLRAMFDAVDPAPPIVVETAKAAFGLRRLDAELAELVRDSIDDRGSLLAIRGEGDVRLISFETEAVTVELQVTERGAQRDLVAQVTGADVANAEVETPQRRHGAALEDSMVTADGVPAGLLRLHLTTGDGRDLVTSWVRV